MLIATNDNNQHQKNKNEEFDQILTVKNAIEIINCGQHYLNETVGISTIGHNIFQIIYDHQSNNLWIIVYLNRSSLINYQDNNNNNLWSLNLRNGYLFVLKEFASITVERMLMEQFRWKANEHQGDGDPEIRIIMGYTKTTGFIFDSYITYDRIEYRFGYYETITGYNNVHNKKMNHSTIITLISANNGQLFQLDYNMNESLASLYRREKHQLLQQNCLHTFYSQSKHGYYFSLNKDPLILAGDERNSWIELQHRLFAIEWKYGFSIQTDNHHYDKNKNEKILFLISNNTNQQIMAMNESLLFDLDGKKMYNIFIMKFNDYFHCHQNRLDNNNILLIIISILTSIILISFIIIIWIIISKRQRKKTTNISNDNDDRVKSKTISTDGYYRSNDRIRMESNCHRYERAFNDDKLHIKCGINHLRNTIGLSKIGDHFYQFVSLDETIRIIRYDYHKTIRNPNIGRNGYQLNLIDGQIMANGLDDILSTNIATDIMKVIQWKNQTAKFNNDNNDQAIISIAMSIDNEKNNKRIVCLKSIDQQHYIIGDYANQIDPDKVKRFFLEFDRHPYIMGTVSVNENGIIYYFYSKQSFRLKLFKLSAQNYGDSLRYEWNKTLYIDPNTNHLKLYQRNEYVQQSLVDPFQRIFSQATFTFGFIDIIGDHLFVKHHMNFECNHFGIFFAVTVKETSATTITNENFSHEKTSTTIPVKASSTTITNKNFSDHHQEKTTTTISVKETSTTITNENFNNDHHEKSTTVVTFEENSATSINDL
ncbi:hypothetical protein BLA29_000761 [Euroglyphus maynei]|uniref:Uncharacterized protein n=1 Tax=Euroglyphus maynei TaxID=6958 RepID=A0A1Y3BJU1_EURMA|nr:hypothetical protein BLA29_000761 [Euroglyphus maynei]